MSRTLSKTATTIQPSSIRAMFNLASSMDDVINLGLGEPDFTTPPNIIKAAEAAMQNGMTHYTLNAGNLDLREAVSQKLSSKNGLTADPKTEIIITNGAMGGLYLSLQVLLNSGDEVILPVPSWTNYSAQILMAQGVPKPLITYERDEYILDPETLKKMITPRTKAFLINTPGNPTGGVYSREILQKLADIAIEYDLIVISDEVYEYFIWEGAEHISIASFPGMAERTVTINSLSKTYAMTGWRVGYTFAPENITAAMTKLQENVYACTNSIAQEAAIEALSGTSDYLDSMILEYSKRRKYMVHALSELSGLRIFKPQGTFYMVVDIQGTGYSPDDFALQLLKKTGVCVVPGTAFGGGGEDFIRISYAKNMLDLENAIGRIQTFLKR
jgi:aminotransferase